MLVSKLHIAVKTGRLQGSLEARAQARGVAPLLTAHIDAGAFVRHLQATHLLEAEPPKSLTAGHESKMPLMVQLRKERERAAQVDLCLCEA